MATNTGLSPKQSHYSLMKSPKSISKIRGMMRRSSSKRKTKLADKTLDNSSDSDAIPLDTSFGNSSLSLTNSSSEAAKSGYRAVVAIDFGTTYSGYAYSFTNHPDDIHLMRSTQAGRYGSALTHKIPTILLLNDKGGFHAFGHEARDAYHDLDETEAAKWLYFEKFKLELHTRQDLNMAMELEASNGKRALATIVFGHALRYFKDSCVKELNDVSIVQSGFSAEDIQWVVTVPAIWRQSAKQFMRYAATQAGLVKPDKWKQLIIALEPEAASIYCQSLYTRESALRVTSPSREKVVSSPSLFNGASKHKTKDAASPVKSMSELTRAESVAHCGVRYIVADCGGGTVDLTVHELTHEKKLKELHKATGGAWGSMGVDCRFEELLSDIFGEDFLIEYVKSSPLSWLELIKTFETKKCSFCLTKQLSVSISLPFTFIESYMENTGKSVRTAVQEYNVSGVQWTSQGMLRLQPSIMMALFQPVVREIVKHIEEVVSLPDVSPIDYLFLVGGFAESPILQEAIQTAFDSSFRVIIPHNVSLTILKGAVMFGHDPTVVHVRRSLHTYGVPCLNEFVPGKHPEELKVVRNGQEWCSGVFDAFVYADQPISSGYVVTRSYTVAETTRQSTFINLHASEEETVQYITDPGCSKVGQLKFGLLEKYSGPREVILSMTFGDTEISVEALDCASGQTAIASVDFLTK